MTYHENNDFSDQSGHSGYSVYPPYREPYVSMLFVSVDRVRARYAATMPGPDRPHDVAWLTRVLASLRDVPLLVTELVQVRRAYADLVAACRAGLVARRDGEPEESAWRYLTDELPAAPLGHPLHPASRHATADGEDREDREDRDGPGGRGATAGGGASD